MATNGGRGEGVRVALAQIDCALGDVPENRRRVQAVLADPAARAADLVVFPELALSGYALGHVDEDVARAIDDAEVAGPAAETAGAFVLGFPEAGRLHVYNTAIYVEGGHVRHVHRKLYLPTYDI